MDRPVTAYLPHRPPFLLVDRLVAHDEGHAEASLAVRRELPLSPGGTLSPFLIAEALAQTAALHAGALTGERGGDPVRHEGALVRLDRFEIPGDAVVRCGDTLVLKVTLERAMGALRRYAAEASVGAQRVATGVFTFATTPVP